MNSVNLKGKGRALEDGLFAERLEMLYEQGLGDLQAFAERENRSFEEVRRQMAELHCRFLFDNHHNGGSSASAQDRKRLINQTLQGISLEFEALETLAGLQSFFLVIDPSDRDDVGFLGGTVQGREFWRGHRGCGAAGAEAFKARYMRTQQKLPSYRLSPISHPPTLTHSGLQPPPPPITEAPYTKGGARELKTELYAAFRDALREASGSRTAEMKWTNHSKLSTYGVQLRGWPANVPSQNPSTLTVAQNKLLLDLLRERNIYFVRTTSTQGSSPETSAETGGEVLQNADTMFEDTIDYSWNPDAHWNDAEPPEEIDTSSSLSIPLAPSQPESMQWDVGPDAGGTPSKRRRVDYE